MSTLKKPSIWRHAESAILPVVTRLFGVGDAIPALQTNKVFRYDGTHEYVGTKDYARLRTQVVLVSSPDAEKAAAELFPIAIGPILRRMSEAPETFSDRRLTDAVHEALRGGGLDFGDFPGFYTNESYYFAFCRELLVRLDRAGAVPISAGAVATDARCVAWVRGTRVKALEVVASHVAHGWSADEIRRQHPGWSSPRSTVRSPGTTRTARRATRSSRPTFSSLSASTPIRGPHRSWRGCAALSALRDATSLHGRPRPARSVSDALRQRGVDVLTAQDDGAATMTDPELLARASSLLRVLVSQDADLIVEARRKIADAEPFAGVVYAHQLRLTIGQPAEEPTTVAIAGEPEDLANRVEFLPLK